jgi:hypothetical protein
VILDNCFPLSIEPVLESQKGIAAHLEDTTELECPWNLRSRSKEPEHFHHIACKPADKHGKSETFARLRLVIRKHLRERERGFDRKPHVANGSGVHRVKGWHGRENKFKRGQDNKEVKEELPISANTSVPSRFGRNCDTYGLGDRHCQKLYGLATPNSPSRWATNGVAASPPLDDGPGR